jgi:hypothetical protein
MLADAYIASGLSVAISGLGLLVLAILYRDYKIDCLRDNLFALRDELFDYAVQEGLLEHAGYRELRRFFNNMIRFCHKISFFRLSLSIAADKLLIPENERVNKYEAWTAGLADLPVYQKDKLVQFHIMMFIVLMRHLADTSVVLGPIVFIFRVRDALSKLSRDVGDTVFSTLVQKTSRGWELMEEQASEARR